MATDFGKGYGQLTPSKSMELSLDSDHPTSLWSYRRGLLRPYQTLGNRFKLCFISCQELEQVS